MELLSPTDTLAGLWILRVKLQPSDRNFTSTNQHLCHQERHTTGFITDLWPIRMGNMYQWQWGPKSYCRKYGRLSSRGMSLFQRPSRMDGWIATLSDLQELWRTKAWISKNTLFTCTLNNVCYVLPMILHVDILSYSLVCYTILLYIINLCLYKQSY